MNDQAASRLSGEFVQWVRKEILYLLLKHPYLVFLHNVAFLWKRLIGHPWPKKGWFPKNYLDNLHKELEHAVFSRIATMARYTQEINNPDIILSEAFRSEGTANRYRLGTGTLNDTFREFIVEVFPIANEIPHFFDHLYEELVRISKLPADHWWHLEEHEGSLILDVDPELRRKRQNVLVVPFKKAKSV